MIGMMDMGDHVIFKRGLKYATILMARVALKVIVLSYTSAVNIDWPITFFLVISNSKRETLIGVVASLKISSSHL
jgi:hypothetical protein